MHAHAEGWPAIGPTPRTIIIWLDCSVLDLFGKKNSFVAFQQISKGGSVVFGSYLCPDAGWCLAFQSTSFIEGILPSRWH